MEDEKAKKCQQCATTKNVRPVPHKSERDTVKKTVQLAAIPLVSFSTIEGGTVQV
jgi:hypothetical protein